MDLYRHVLRPLLFRLDAETAHRFCKPALQSPALCRWLAGPPLDDPRLQVRVGSLTLANPVGLAPGFDKYAELTAGLSRLGFGYLVPGTVMAEPRGDAPRPRLLRLPAQEALVNCMGLPSHGPDYSARQIERGRSAVPLVVSIGGSDQEGFLRCHARMEPLAGAMELNLQCHNEGEGAFWEPKHFDPLITAIVRRKRKPVFLKVNAYHGPVQRQERLAMVERGLALGLDGFSALGTFVMQADPRLSRGVGVVSGRPLLKWTLAAIADIRDVTRGRAVIRARGGIFSGADAFQAMAAGATTVEVFTGLVYEGWAIARRINTELLALMAREKLPSLAALRGIGGTAPAPASDQLEATGAD